MNKMTERLESAADAVAKEITKKTHPPGKLDSVIAELRRTIVKCKSTSGITMRAAEMNIALDKLRECEQWIFLGGNKQAVDRLTECLFWAKDGMRE